MKIKSVKNFYNITYCIPPKFYVLTTTSSRYDMCRRRKGGRCTKGTAGNSGNFLHLLRVNTPATTNFYICI